MFKPGLLGIWSTEQTWSTEPEDQDTWSIASQGHQTSLLASHRGSREDTTMRTEEENEPPKGKVKEDETRPRGREAEKALTQDFVIIATR